MQARTEAAINHVKSEQGKFRSRQLAFEAGLLDPEMVFRSIGFTNFLSTWLIRQVDPKKLHPSPLVEYVLVLDEVASLSNGYSFQVAFTHRSPYVF